MQETWVQFLGREDPLEEETATHSSSLAWEIPGPQCPWGESHGAHSAHRERATVPTSRERRCPRGETLESLQGLRDLT